MKRPIGRLTLQSETIRALQTLDLDDLAIARGGDEVVRRFESTGTCPAAIALGTKLPACG
jgi:hypothetical protein